MLNEKRDSLAKYLAMVGTHSRLFTNPVGPIFEILLDEDGIHQAQAAQEKRLSGMGFPAEWAQVGLVYEDQYLFILRDAVRFPDGSTGTYIRLLPRWEQIRGVAVLPVRDGRVVLINHFRHATRSWHPEVPRGFGTPGQSPEDDVRRELQEEIGANTVRIEHLGEMHTNTGISSECVDVFMATVESVGEPELAEAISDIREVNVDEFERLISDGVITDSFTIACYVRAKLRGLLGGSS